MTNSTNPLRQWGVLRLWRLRCWWAGRRLTPGVRVRVTGDGAFRGETGTVSDTDSAIPMWRLVELDRPITLGGVEYRVVNFDAISLRMIPS